MKECQAANGRHAAESMSNKRVAKAVCRVSCICQCFPLHRKRHFKAGRVLRGSGMEKYVEASTRYTKSSTSLYSGLPVTCNPGRVSQRVGPQRVGYTGTTLLALLLLSSSHHLSRSKPRIELPKLARGEKPILVCERGTVSSAAIQEGHVR